MKRTQLATTDRPARHADDRGAVLVEVALVLPVLVMLLVGIVEFGRGYSAKIELAGAVREGARYAALGSADTTVISKTKDAAAGLSADRLTVAVTPCSIASVTARVVATYPFSYDIPFFGSRATTLTATGAMRCGG